MKKVLDENAENLLGKISERCAVLRGEAGKVQDELSSLLCANIGGSKLFIKKRRKQIFESIQKINGIADELRKLGVEMIDRTLCLDEADDKREE